MHNGAARKAAELLHGYRLEAEQQGWDATAGGGMHDGLEAAIATAVQLLTNVYTNSAKHAKNVLAQAPHLLGDLAFFGGARQGTRVMRDTAACSLKFAANMMLESVLGPAELHASGLGHAAAEAIGRTSWQAADCTRLRSQTR